MKAGATVQISTVLCPVDFSEISAREVELAAEICRVFGARLILHHNVAATTPALARAWEWNQVHRTEKFTDTVVEHSMKALLARAGGVQAEASITSGPVAPVLLSLVENLPADLLVLGSHGWSTEDHASISERIVERCPCPIVATHETSAQSYPFRLRGERSEDYSDVVVLTDFSEAAASATEYAFGLARAVPIWLHLLHVAPAPTSQTPQALAELSQLRPPDLERRIECHVETGDPSTQIVTFVRRTDPAFLVMGQHAKGLRGFFTHDTAREILHRVNVPVWFVPRTYTE